MLQSSAPITAAAATASSTSSSSINAPTAATSAAVAAENLAVEHTLLRTLIEFLQYSYKYHNDLLAQASSLHRAHPVAVASAEFANILLIHLRQCLKTAMVTQMEKRMLQQALLSDRARAELMHVVVQIGDKVSSNCDPQLREEWVQTREAFMSMLDS